MIRRVVLPCLVVALMTAAPPLQGQSPQQTPSPDELRAIMESAGPGPEHRALAALAGRFSQEITYRMGGSAAPPMRVAGSAENRLILGGRFLVSESTSTNPAGPMLGGPVVETMTVYGFDRRTSRYTIVGFDTMGTYWVSAEGQQTGASIVMSGETIDDHAGSRRIQRYDMVLDIVDANTYVTRVVFKFDGRPDLTLVEIVHRRQR